ncbi:hypothetical protein ABIF03_006293 [Bradyrhizobium elkanii]
MSLWNDIETGKTLNLCFYGHAPTLFQRQKSR